MNDIVNMVKDNDLLHIKSFFEENELISEDFDNFDNIIYDLIKSKVSIEKIEFILEQRHPKNYEKIFIYCLETENDKMANILYNEKIKNINEIKLDNKNVIEYLLDRNTLTSVNLQFILNKKGNPELFTGKVMCTLIHMKKVELLDIISKFEFNFVNSDTNISTCNIKESLGIPLNNKDEHDNYALLEAVKTCILNFVKNIINYAECYNIILNMNDKDKDNNYPLLQAIEYEEKDIVNVLFEYAKRHNIILNIDEDGKKGNNPFLLSIAKNNEYLFNLLMEYSEQNKLIINIIKSNDYNDSSLFKSISNNNINIMKKLINYANKYGIILNINQKNYEGEYPFLKAIEINNIEIVEYLINYSNNNNIILNISEKDEKNNFPLLMATQNKNIEIINKIIEYSLIHKFDTYNLIKLVNTNNNNNYLDYEIIKEFNIEWNIQNSLYDKKSMTYSRIFKTLDFQWYNILYTLSFIIFKRKYIYINY